MTILINSEYDGTGTRQFSKGTEVKPGIDIVVVTIARHACDQVLKRILKLLIYRLQTFLVKCKYLRSIQLCEDQDIPAKLEKLVCNHVLVILTTYMETRLYTVNSCFNMLAFQLFWEFKPFGKQLPSEKQIKPAIKLNLEFMKQNERENQRI